MNLLYMNDDRLIMSSRVFYMDSYEDLKIASVGSLMFMKTRRPTVLGG